MTMYKNRFEGKLSQDQDKKDISFEDKQKSSTKLLDIWGKIPSYKDISTKLSIRKLIFVISILTFFLISLKIITKSITTALILTVFLVIFFMVALNLNNFHLRNLIISITQSFKVLIPFECFSFWIPEEDPATLLIMNKEDKLKL